MILIIKSTLSINNTHRSIQWLMSYTISNNPSPFSLIIRMITTQFIHSHDNEYNRFKREGFMMEHSSDPTDQLSQSLFSTQWSDFNNPSLTIPFVSLIHPILSLLLWRTDCYSLQSIWISVLPTLFIVIISMTVRYHHTVSLSTHQSIHMDTKHCMITIR